MNCPDCNRRTPAGRAVCIYCGASLPVARIETTPRQRQIENSELAFNTVIDPARARVDEQTEAALASALQIEPIEAHAYVVTGKRVPIARSLTRQEAELIAALMRTCGVAASVVADEDLRLGKDLVRARRITRDQGQIEIHHSAGHVTIDLADIRLLVIGLIRNTRVDYSESMTRSRSNTGGLVDSSEFRTDEMLVDVYTTSLEQSFRIKADAFDYSGLVWPLSFRAEVNFNTAISALRGAAPQAKIDEDFSRIRGLLGRAWPERSHVEARGVKRTGIYFRPIAQSSVISNNHDQFDRYSRLMFLLQG